MRGGAQDEDMYPRYVHLGSGNYNSTTARLYTDLGLFTGPWNGAEVGKVFNLLTWGLPPCEKIGWWRRSISIRE